MPHSHSSPDQAKAAERRTKALDLRKAGKTFREIGEVMGFSEQRAHHIVTLELQRLNARRAEAAADVARLESERLDALMAGIWDVAKGGDIEAIGAAIRIMNRRAKLCGLDAPTKRQVTGEGGGPVRFTLEDLLPPLPSTGGDTPHAAPPSSPNAPLPDHDAAGGPSLPG